MKIPFLTPLLKELRSLPSKLSYVCPLEDAQVLKGRYLGSADRCYLDSQYSLKQYQRDFTKYLLWTKHCYKHITLLQ